MDSSELALYDPFRTLAGGSEGLSEFFTPIPAEFRSFRPVRALSCR